MVLGKHAGCVVVRSLDGECWGGGTVCVCVREWGKWQEWVTVASRLKTQFWLMLLECERWWVFSQLSRALGQEKSKCALVFPLAALSDIWRGNFLACGQAMQGERSRQQEAPAKPLINTLDRCHLTDTHLCFHRLIKQLLAHWIFIVSMTHVYFQL